MKRKFSTKDIAIIGMMIAINMVALTIKIPFGTGAMVHLGTASVFALAIVFGGKKGGLAGGLATFMFDLIMGYPMYALWSLVAKGGAGFIVGITLRKTTKDTSYTKILTLSIIGCVLASIWNLAVYFQSWVFVIGSVEVAIGNIPSSIISSSVGMLIGIPLGMTLKKLIPKDMINKPSYNER